MKFKNIAKGIAPFALAAGLILGGTTAAHASQGSGNMWRAVDEGNSPYINAWNGGPAIAAYSGQALNDDFSYDAPGYLTSYYNMSFTPGSGTYNEYCIGDYGNNSNDARAALSYCAVGEVPWGANFNITTCSIGGSNGWEFYDIHWGGWLGIPTNNGGQAYLNVSGPTCFVFYPAY